MKGLFSRSSVGAAPNYFALVHVFDAQCEGLENLEYHEMVYTIKKILFNEF